ncbi:VOC family protein [Nocardiopsis sp. MG754419]|uniref:VOC family protein n=1 Tax=Nocardiopsis sp. MG754419 TaxID=2259865 RepID=UPI001BA5EFA6|nr:VOC family protein [Nocardiopsis sp. MG754419]MBR8742092.1 VOC family protein [Nocardiopsis sp. MG754419]
MPIATTTHLNFRGRAREALDFYHSVFGGDVVAITYADAHAVRDPDEADRIMWGQVASEDGFRVMAYDVPGTLEWNPGENSYFVSVRGDDTEEITTRWDRLSVGSTIVRPLEPAQWSPLYGMLRDRFGVTWVLDVTAPDQG